MIDQQSAATNLDPSRLRREFDLPPRWRNRLHPRECERARLGPANVGDEVHHVSILTHVARVFRVIREGLYLRLHRSEELRPADPIQPGAFESEIVMDECRHRDEIAAIESCGVVLKDLLRSHGAPL